MRFCGINTIADQPCKSISNRHISFSSISKSPVKSEFHELVSLWINIVEQPEDMVTALKNAPDAQVFIPASTVSVQKG